MDLIDLSLSILYLITLFYTIFWLLTLMDPKEEKKLLKHTNPLVTVTIPAYNEADTISRTLQSVVELEYPPDKLEIIVVNDGSTDSTAQRVNDFIDKNPTHSIVLIGQPNQGKWKALNTALKSAKGTFFVCLDADSFVEQNALNKMLPHFTTPDVGAVVPLIKIKDPTTLMQKIQWYEFLVNMFYKRLLGILNCIHVTPGPFSLYRTSILRDIGLFRRAHLTEDLEMALRLQKYHYKIIQILDAEVYTVMPTKLKDIYRQRNRWNKGSVLNVWSYKNMMFRKEYGDFGMFQMPIVLSAGFIALFLVSFVLYKAVLKPLVIGLNNLAYVNFDIFTFIANFKWNFVFLDLDYYSVFILGAMFIISMGVLIIAHIFTKERITKQGFFPLMAYIFFYYIFLGAVWVGIVRDLVLKRKEQW